MLKSTNVSSQLYQTQIQTVNVRKILEKSRRPPPPPSPHISNTCIDRNIIDLYFNIEKHRIQLMSNTYKALSCHLLPRTGRYQ